jgi:PAS domain S-box-containing protein
MLPNDPGIYEKMFELSNDAVFIVDEQGFIKNANARARELYGYTHDEFLNKSVLDLHPAEDKERNYQILQETFEQHYKRFHNKAIRKDGEIREVEISASRIQETKPSLFIAIVRDVTEQYAAHQQIRQLSLFPEQNPYPVIRVNGAYQIEYANQASQELLNFLDIQNGDRLPVEWQQQVEFICQNGNCHQQKPTFEYQVDDRFYLFTVSFIPQSDQMYLYGQDITDLKNYQQELKAANEELSTFIYKTHHDLKHPLSSLLGLVQVGQLEVSDETAQQYLKMIDQSANKLDNILHSLIKAIEIKDGKKHPKTFTLEGLISDLKTQETLFEGAEHVHVYHQIADEVNQLYTDRDALCYALENLIGNAVKYRDDDKPEQWVGVKAYLADKDVILQVTDNGIGIPESYQERIFDMFYRATNLKKGSGLGLYITEKAIRKLEGQIAVESDEGKGTKFYISIPKTTG